ncbi:MAG: hypothetical protein ABIC95_07305 [archaeon]
MKRLLKAFLYACVLAFVSLIGVSLLWDNPLILTLALIMLSAVMMFASREKHDIYLFAIAGLSGAIAEMMAIWSGAWQYAFPNLLGIPYWLPFLWGFAALFIRRMSLEIDSFLGR